MEIGAGGYPGKAHCDPDVLLADEGKLKAFKNAVESRGLIISALSAHGNPLHPQKDIAKSFHDDLIKTIDLAQRLSQNEGKAFAQRLVASLENETTMLRNAHRQADFAVLKAPDVPSVLIELGYLSNASDEHRLRSSDHQARIVGGIVRAIDDYFGWLDGESR